MKLPRGFGKNYFSLSAITATVNQITLHQEVSRVQNFHFQNGSIEKDEEELEELEELTLCQTQELSQNSCHCNCFFKSLTRKTLQLFTYEKKYDNYYILLNTDISPPKIDFIQI